MALTALETARYAEVWDSLDKYGNFAPGEEYLPIFLELLNGQRGTLLDAGTGSGKGALALQAAGFDVVACDLTDEGLTPEARANVTFRQACLWRPLRPVLPRGYVEWVYCTDVLEHLPTQFTMLAIEQMLRVATRGLFLSVCLVPDQAGVWIGHQLHQTVQPFVWWRDSLAELGTIVNGRDLITTATFLVSPR